MEFNILDGLNELEIKLVTERLENLDISLEDINNKKITYYIFEMMSDEELKALFNNDKDEKITKTEKQQKTKKSKNKEPSKEEQKKDQQKIVKDINEDLYNINILSNVPKMDLYENIRRISKTNRPTYEVVLPQSGYCAKMRGLRADEIDLIKNSTSASDESGRDTLVKIVYDCIEDVGFTPFTKEMFEEKTSFLDFDILLFGILHQTYGAVNSYTFKCNSCQSEFDKNIITEHLIHVKSDKIKSEIDKLINAVDKLDEFNNSLLSNYNKRIREEESGIIVEYSFSNLIKDKIINRIFNNLDSDMKTTRRFLATSLIQRVFMPVVNESGELTGSYIEETNPLEIYTILDNIPSKGLNKVLKEIGAIADDYTVSFKTPELVCPYCSNSIPSEDIKISYYFLVEVVKDGLGEI